MIEVNNPLDDWQPPTSEELAEYQREAEEEALGHLAERVGEDARTTPLWEDFADEVGVHADEGEQYVGLPPDHPDHQRYFDLEYGTEDIAPTGFLRNALTRHGPETGRHFGEGVLRRVWGWR